MNNMIEMITAHDSTKTPLKGALAYRVKWAAKGENFSTDSQTTANSIMIESSYVKFETLLKEMEALRIASQVESRYIATIYGYSWLPEAFFDSEIYKLYILSEDITDTLALKVREQKTLGTLLDEQRIWEFIAVVVSALKTKLANQMYVITPHDILYTPSGIKLRNPFLIPSSYNLHDARHLTSFVSPSLMAIMVVNPDDLQVSSLKSTSNIDSLIWSLGMVILHATTGEEMEKCYRRETGSVDRIAIDSLVRKTSDQYSSRLFELLNRMLNPEKGSRPTLEMIETYLPQHLRHQNQSGLLSNESHKNQRNSGSNGGSPFQSDDDEGALIKDANFSLLKEGHAPKLLRKVSAKTDFDTSPLNAGTFNNKPRVKPDLHAGFIEVRSKGSEPSTHKV
jgi:hypothetical protein